MKYNLLYSQSARKYLKKLPKVNRHHIISVLERARIRPQAHFERLVGKRTYKIRAGSYRIIADINDGNISILVIKKGHRRDIYK